MIWKARPLSPEQSARMMTIWGKLEAEMAENPNVERLNWYIFSDGSGGIAVTKSVDVDSGIAFELEASLSLSEFLEIESKVVLDLEGAMPAILKSIEHTTV